MNWMKNMNDALDFIENNIYEDFSIDDIAKVACSSKSHFTKMFLMLSNITISEYIRKRRLTLAASDVSSTDIKIIDIAFKYGYKTPEAFSKSFKSLHGYSPSEARALDIKLNAYPPLSFQVIVKGENKMNYKIVEKEAFKLTGTTINLGTKNDENFIEIPKFWQSTFTSGNYMKYNVASSDGSVVGATLIPNDYDYTDENSRFDYLIGVLGTEDGGVENCSTYDVEKHTWAIFESRGDEIKNTWKRIYSEWFPATNYEHAIAPELEVYPVGDITNESYRLEIWIPVVKK